MVRTVSIGVIGLVLSLVPAWSKDLKADRDFVTRASIGNLVAIAESRLALDQASEPSLKAFAHQMLDGHGTAQAALQAAADGSQTAVPTTLDREHQARVTALQGKSGVDFDKAYVADQLEIHSNALTLYGDYMLLGDDAKLKALAIRMIPIAEAQFTSVQALARN